MTAAGVTRARSRRRAVRVASHRGPVVVARATLSVADPAAAPAALSPSRRDFQVARRLRRRDALVSLGILAAALGMTVCVLDMVH
jgi:hypothetical protein